MTSIESGFFMNRYLTTEMCGIRFNSMNEIGDESSHAEELMNSKFIWRSVISINTTLPAEVQLLCLMGDLV